MTLAECLDVGLLMIRHHWRELLPIAALMLLVDLATTPPEGTVSELVGVAIAYVSIVASAILVGSLVQIAGAITLGKRCSLRAALWAPCRRLPAIFFALLAFGSSLGMCVGGLFGAFALLTRAWDLVISAGVVVVGLALVVGGIGVAAAALLPRTALIAQSALIEGLGPLASVRRSWRLTRGHATRTLLFLLLAVGLFSLLVAGTTLMDTESWVSWLVIEALSTAFIISLTPASVALYFDLRCRSEAFDLEVLARRVTRE